MIFCEFFWDGITVTNYMKSMLGCLVSCDCQRIWNKVILAKLRYSVRICMEYLIKQTECLNTDNLVST